MLITAARMIEKGLACTKEATMAKLFATETSVELCDMAIQICGGAGYVKDYYPLERFYRDARLGTIGGGTSEIMRYLIQREVYIESKRDKATKTVSPAIVSMDFDTMMSFVPNGFRPDRAEGVSAKIQFTFSDSDPWVLTIIDKKCEAEKTQIENPSMTVKTDSGTWRNILLGKLDAMQAMMTELVVIDTDDMELLMKFARMFKFTPEMFRGTESLDSKPKKSEDDSVPKFRLGKTLDEIEVGEKVEDAMVVTDEIVKLYGEMSGDYNPLHFDDEYAATTMFGKRIAHGPIGGALVARLLGMKLPGLGTLAYNMKVNFKAPVYIGDALRAVAEVTEKLPESNLCRISFEVFNQDDILVMDGYANVMPPIKE
jgi:3-hydroxybutyryl-CoA dehydratase